MTPPNPGGLGRRRFLASVSAVAGAAALAQLPVGPAAATPKPAGGGYPFRLGVASGEPASSGVVLWTRLAPEPFAPGGGMPPTRVPVQWQVARDARFRHVVRAGSAWALPELAHSVHVEVHGLAPDREWFYRFRYRTETSPTGRTRTAPAPWAPAGALAFAFVSCQNWTDGYYPSYRHLAGDDLDLVLHLGDYVYEGAIPADGGYRRVATPDTLRSAPQDLERWRMQYALYKSDPELQAAHARFPWLVTWDDHEVKNDYANTRQEHAGDISALRAAAYQAWYEHQPVRPPSRPDVAGGPRIHRRLEWGRLAQLNLLDGRQYRSVPPCGWGEADACPAAYEPDVTMLGFEQERWLYGGLAASRARWNILGNNVMLARLDHDGPDGSRLWHDAWDGFPAARKRLTDTWMRHGVANPVVVTGDWHSTFVNDIHADFDRPDSPVVGTEIVGTSISSNGDGEVYGPYYGPMIKHNPHIRFFDGDRRGYVRCRVGRRELRADLKVVSTVSTRDAPESTFASFVVEDGRPGAHRV
ncbi:alkaline phosphatase D family protein [Prauserella muralis]|uniref:Alkaline phosphatase n=1 Tax=Prauserella muralis TaxID=588067 RepID=A0A2V4AYE7_9PSEU|nr:alkaline phosphatase D family protein [Prauserella muralis]PXY26912.1 alkaline phosphatase [Prauserella muralis]TWE23478.1 alkaline phosphatase D [Prauserella muralis]